MEENGVTEDLKKTGLQLSWLEHATDNREVGGSNPLEPTKANPKGLQKMFIENRIEEETNR